MTAFTRDTEERRRFVYGLNRSPAERRLLETVIAAERLGLVPITTPAYSPQSNGMAAAFVNTLRRAHIAGADLSSAAVVFQQLPAWRADYNGIAPHSALGYRAPHEYRTPRAAEVG